MFTYLALEKRYPGLQAFGCVLEVTARHVDQSSYSWPYLRNLRSQIPDLRNLWPTKWGLTPSFKKILREDTLFQGSLFISIMCAHLRFLASFPFKYCGCELQNGACNFNCKSEIVYHFTFFTPQWRNSITSKPLFYVAKSSFDRFWLQVCASIFQQVPYEV